MTRVLQILDMMDINQGLIILYLLLQDKIQINIIKRNRAQVIVCKQIITYMMKRKEQQLLSMIEIKYMHPTKLRIYRFKISKIENMKSCKTCFKIYQSYKKNHLLVGNLLNSLQLLH